MSLPVQSLTKVGLDDGAVNTCRYQQRADIAEVILNLEYVSANTTVSIQPGELHAAGLEHPALAV
jgi:hypothetical protein